MGDNSLIHSAYSTKDVIQQKSANGSFTSNKFEEEHGRFAYQEDDGEIVEEQIHGKVVLGSDGKYYFEIPTNLDNLDLEKFDTVKVLDSEDGKKTLLIENVAQRDELITKKARARIEASIRRKGDQTFSASFPQPFDFEVVQEEVLESINDDGPITNIIYNEFGEFNGKLGRPRVPGLFHCKECGQCFMNMARLERHLAVHQQYGAYLCPLCGKTYKYEYNLFYHWRRTCRDMNELLSHDERKIIEINALRQLVEEIAQKKASIGTLELTGKEESNTEHYIWENPFNSGVNERLINRPDNFMTPQNLFGDKLAHCVVCQLDVYQKHLSNHLAVHRGQRFVDEPSVGGAFFCDLCGLMFREHKNLMKHWRTCCPGIMRNISSNCDITMDDTTLKEMVFDLIKKYTSTQMDELNQQQNSFGNEIIEQSFTGTLVQHETQPIFGDYHNISQQSIVDKQRLLAADASLPQRFDETWATNEGVMFADELLDAQESTLMIADDGKLITRMQQQQPCTSESSNQSFEGQYSIPTSISLSISNPSSYGVRNADGQLKWIEYSKSVQCNECFRSFSSVQRLEKHMIGSHLSFGTHHCLLCGSRFKYEYNLLFHYRHVCSYSIELLSEEARQQMEAVDLKKTIRQLASRGDFHINPLTIKAMDREDLEQKEHPKLGDSLIRRQMMKKIIQKFTPNRQFSDSDIAQQNVFLPPNLLQASGRSDLPDGTQCPICSVVFYGLKVLARHLKAAHPNESVIWEKTLRALDSRADSTIENSASQTIAKLKPAHIESRKRKAETAGISREQRHEENEERPPQLEIEGS